MPGLGQVNEIGEIAQAFGRMLVELRASTERLEDLVFKLGALNDMVEMAARASDALKAEGINARVLNMSTIKPLDTDAILKAAEETKGIVTAEEHHVTGGLGGAVAEFLSQNRPTKMRIVGLGDDFAVVGPTPALRTRYGMSAENIAAKAKELL